MSKTDRIVIFTIVGFIIGYWTAYLITTSVI